MDTVVLVTGAAQGLGREVARQLAQQGATVLLRADGILVNAVCLRG